jgi:hypothetical protein
MACAPNCFRISHDRPLREIWPADIQQNVGRIARSRVRTIATLCPLLPVPSNPVTSRGTQTVRSSRQGHWPTFFGQLSRLDTSHKTIFRLNSRELGDLSRRLRACPNRSAFSRVPVFQEQSPQVASNALSLRDRIMNHRVPRRHFKDANRPPKVLAAFLSPAALAICACVASSAVPATEAHQRHVLARPADSALHADRETSARPPAQLIGLQATLTQVYPIIDANADGFDLWPCFGSSPLGNPDCPSVGNPLIILPTGGAVLGFPSYVWKLESEPGAGNGIGCDALINGTTGTAPSLYRPCAQLATWYEDETNDSTDDLLQRIVVRQGARVIYDSGLVDYGPAGPAVTYPVDVILNTDVNFGFWPGSAVGPNNGNCSGDTGYPLASPSYPGTIYVVAADQHCDRPEAGPAHVATFTELATPKYTLTTGPRCAGAATCYTVTWSVTHIIHQDFDVFFE